jgi:membrane protease YdiL (CAAX protease family)
MFGVAHIGVPLSIPILILVGFAFAGARIASRGLALPISLHFLHNLAILAMSA